MNENYEKLKVYSNDLSDHEIVVEVIEDKNGYEIEMCIYHGGELHGYTWMTPDQARELAQMIIRISNQNNGN